MYKTQIPLHLQDPLTLEQRYDVVDIPPANTKQNERNLTAVLL